MEVTDQTLFDGQFKKEALGFSNAPGCRVLAAGRRGTSHAWTLASPPCEESAGRVYSFGV